MKLFVRSFGCQMSVADGEEMSRPLLQRGLVPAAGLQDADAAIVNTCTVRRHAEDKAVSYIGRLRDWKDERPDRFLIVAGCAAERLGDSIRRRFPFVDLVVGAKSLEEYPELLEQALRERFDWAAQNRAAWGESGAAQASPDVLGPPVSEDDPERRAAPGGSANGGTVAGGPASAYVTIMRGCNYACSYCIVPSVRGRELYRPMDTVLSEVRRRVRAGAREVTLLGQTVNSYRPVGGEDFSDLLGALESVPGLERVRFMSPHPYYLGDRLLRAMAASSRVCRHIHLPLQSGSDRVLKRMRRNYTAGEFLDKVGRLRRAVPGIAVTTDVIVGFPGETEEDFGSTLAALRSLDPASAYCFKYSPRPGTEAAELPDDVPLEVKEGRLSRTLELVDAGMRRHLEAWRGRAVRVLLEDRRFGRTEHFFRAVLDVPGLPGEIVEGTVAGATPTCLEVAAGARSAPARMPPAPAP